MKTISDQYKGHTFEEIPRNLFIREYEDDGETYFQMSDDSVMWLNPENEELLDYFE